MSLNLTVTVDEPDFRFAIARRLRWIGPVRSVMGPGRSGSIASVYASHLLGATWFPPTAMVPDHLRPLLVIDTAMASGRTLRKLANRHKADLSLAIFNEPPRVRFWYERQEVAC